MYKGKVKADNPNSQPQGIMNFIRDFNKRHEFSWRASGLPEDITLDIYIFFRAFHNPDLEGFSQLKLHQYHILFQLLEHELRYMETEMQGIDLKFVIFSALTCSNMSKFLK